VLVPAPDYPLWTAAVSLSSGTPRHYLCDEGNDWLPDLEDLRAKITPRTRALVVINPNNPTGALYPDQRAARDGRHRPSAQPDHLRRRGVRQGALRRRNAYGDRFAVQDVLTVTFNGLSKNYRSCGYRAGWMVVSGDLREARDYIEGLDMLSSMRLCANVPAQHAIQTALGGYQSIDDLVAPGGRMCRQRDLAHELITAIPGVSCVKPKAALYMFPRLDPKIYPIANDQDFIAELLTEERVLLVQGSGFNWPAPDHFPPRLPAL
jgi:alanine-synthesizing transaminase